jgi:alanine racemase
MQKTLPLSYIEINKNNLIHNVKQIRSLLKKDTKFAAVVKSNAYGHGDIEVVKILNNYVDYFQVNSIEELERIRKYTKKPILVFGYVAKFDLEKAIKLGCILSVFDFEHLILINKTAQKLNKKQIVHIAVDSCLGREGIMPNEIEKFVKELLKFKNITVDGIYSHFANIEDTANFAYAQKQIDSYRNTLDIFKKYGFTKIKTHISATSGIMVYEKNLKKNNNIVRAGIGIYGMWPSEYLEKKLKNKITLKPVLTWKTHIAQIKILPAGHSVGYGLTYFTPKETKIAVIPQGYADGVDRKLSNKGEVLIKSKRCRILGRVAMNMFVVNISNLEKVETNEEVVILGKQGKEEITTEELADKIDTINYEITTRISGFLPRIIK